MTAPLHNAGISEQKRKLLQLVLGMAGQAQLNFERSMEALVNRDSELAKAVVADDDEVDDFERRIDALGMEILGQFHPVATDLRFVITSMKVSSNLERISDHSVNIAKRVKRMVKRSEVIETQWVEPVYAMALNLVRHSMQSFTDRNSVMGFSLNAADKELDRLHKKVISNLSSRMEEGGQRVEDYLHLIFITRSLERIGDLAVNIGEDAIFLDQAEDIRHGVGRDELRDRVVGDKT